MVTPAATQLSRKQEQNNEEEKKENLETT